MSVSPDVVARYAADVAREVDGVVEIVEGVRKGVRVDENKVELHLALRWGSSAAEVGTQVQREVEEYLGRMTDARPAEINVVIERFDGARDN